MILLDTHAWIWWASELEPLSPAARLAVDEAERIGISAISAWEVSVLVRRGRLSFDREVREWIRDALAQPRVVELPITAPIALTSAMLEGLPPDPADRMLVATALLNGCPLVTRDERLRAYPAVRTVW